MNIATPELAAYFRAAIKMMDGEVLGEDFLVKLVEESSASMAMPVQPLHELTPLETECLLLELSLCVAVVAKPIEVSMVIRSNMLTQKDKLKAVMAANLNLVSGLFLARLLLSVEEESRANGSFPTETANVVCLDIINDTLCISAGKLLPSCKKEAAAEYVARTFDLSNWQPADGKTH